MGNNLVQNLTKISGVLFKWDLQNEASKPIFYITDHDVRCEENLDFRIMRTDHGNIETYLALDLRKGFNL